jgi:uncharacterized membrane protein YbaN (DUF454 family)
VCCGHLGCILPVVSITSFLPHQFLVSRFKLQKSIRKFHSYTVRYEGFVSYVDVFVDGWPVPVAARSKVCVCCRSLAGITGPNPTGGMDVCFL